MRMLSELKFQLENVSYIDTHPEIWFPKPLKVQAKDVQCDDPINYVCVKKKGRIIKLCTISDSVTLSATDKILQWYVYRVLLSMTDPRYPFDFEKVYEVDTIKDK